MSTRLKSRGCAVWAGSVVAWLAGGAIVIADLDRVEAGPITFNSALPVPQGVFIFRGQAILSRSTDDSSTMDRDRKVLTIPAVFAYGVTRDFAVFGIVPYHEKRLELTTSSGRVRRGDSGVGDSTFLVRYTLLAIDRLGDTRRFAPFVGLKAPTGDDDQVDGLGRLPQPLQLGSGSWDPIAGTSFTWQTFDWEFDAAVQYRVNTEANNFEFGDQARADASFQYRLWPPTLGSGVPTFFYGVIESNLVYAGKNTVEGVSDPNSGGITWLLAPGLQYVTRRVVLEAIVQIPVVQDLNGTALERDYIVRGGFRVNF
ncbi:MAG: transporter [Nitrospirae bacterium]|nr:MAG: transporter [Nitrospirota bacterium]